jgi:hypothetical protein
MFPFLLRELGSDRTPSALVRRIFVDPFFAGSFAGFWRKWNPVYRYFLWSYIYRPLKHVS